MTNNSIENVLYEIFGDPAMHIIEFHNELVWEQEYKQRVDNVVREFSSYFKEHNDLNAVENSVLTRGYLFCIRFGDIDMHKELAQIRRLITAGKCGYYSRFGM